MSMRIKIDIMNNRLSNTGNARLTVSNNIEKTYLEAETPINMEFLRHRKLFSILKRILHQVQKVKKIDFDM